MTPFGQRLTAAMRDHGPLCVGIDPHPQLLDAWGLTNDYAGLERFALTCVEAFGGHVAAVKPQSAFFEAGGARGIALLERVLNELQGSSTLSILDVKRGDIGSTMQAYARAYLAADAPAAADAITLSPYLGYEALRPALDLARQHGKGAFVLALTSNPEGFSVQQARDSGGVSVAASVARGAARDNAAAAGQSDHLPDIGLVVGANLGAAIREAGLDLVDMRGPILAPGLGAQGANPTDLPATFAAAMPQVVATSSRAVLRAGPNVGALRQHALDLAAQLVEVVGR